MVAAAAVNAAPRALETQVSHSGRVPAHSGRPRIPGTREPGERPPAAPGTTGEHHGSAAPGESGAPAGGRRCCAVLLRGRGRGLPLRWRSPRGEIWTHWRSTMRSRSSRLRSWKMAPSSSSGCAASFQGCGKKSEKKRKEEHAVGSEGRLPSLSFCPRLPFCQRGKRAEGHKRTRLAGQNKAEWTWIWDKILLAVSFSRNKRAERTPHCYPACRDGRPRSELHR